jgi:hypothetical protein
MSYPIDTTIPNEPNDPADDCPLMRQNYTNIKNYLTVDHVEAGAPGNGFHKEVTFYDKVAQGLPVDPTSVLYTASGTASTVADMRFRNANGIFPVNAIRACAVFTTGGAPVVSNGINVGIITRLVNVFTINLTANAVTSTNPIVLVYMGDASSASYTFAANTLTVTTTVGASSGVKMNFIILEI